jgi:transposase InsO family protein
MAIRDRDTSYGRDADIGITTVLTPVRAPQTNSIAERVSGILRREYLDHVIMLRVAPGASQRNEWRVYAARPH